MNKNLLLIGGGGHCKSIIESLSRNNDFDKIAIVDLVEKTGTTVLGVTVIGCDNDLSDLYKSFKYGFVSIGTIGNTSTKIGLYNKINNIGFIIPNIIDITSIVSNYTKLGTGVYIGAKSFVNANTTIGNGAVINTNSIVEHDCEIGDFCHVAPGATVCGNVRIGNNTHIGAGTTIKQGVNIGESVMIGIGSVVTKNIASNITAYGNPCRERI